MRIDPDYHLSKFGGPTKCIGGDIVEKPATLEHFFRTRAFWGCTQISQNRCWTFGRNILQFGTIQRRLAWLPVQG